MPPNFVRASASCACELRSLAPFTDAGFIAFREYVGTLKRWGIFANDVNPCRGVFTKRVLA